MAETPKAEPKKKIIRKKPGYRKVMVTLREDQAKRLDELAAADDRGSATNMLTVIIKRNFEALIKTVQPVAPTFQFGVPVNGDAEKPYTINDPKE